MPRTVELALAVAGCALPAWMLAQVVRGAWKAHRRRWERDLLSFCRSCGEPQQGGYCANCTPLARLQPFDAATERGREQDRRRRWPSPTSPDTIEHLLGPTVEER